MTSPTVLLLGVTATLLFALTVLGVRFRSNQGADLFALLTGASGVWVGTTIVGLTRPPGALRIRLWGVTSGLSLLVIVLWIGFILSYTGRRDWLTVRRLGVLSLPLVFGAAAYAFVPRWPLLVGSLSQEVRPAGTVVTVAIRPIGALLGVYVYLVFAVGLGIVVKTVLEGSRLFVGQALSFIVGSLVTIVASALVVLGVSPDGYPLTQVALGVQSLLFGYAVFGQQLLQVVPAVAEIGEQAVFTDLNDGVLVVDDDGVVLRANPAAASYLGDRLAVGATVVPVLDLMGADSIEDLPTRFEHEGRTFRADVSEICNWQGGPIGNTVVVRDVTRLVTREQRLAVLNRVLRHNVRNEMTVVKGVAEQLQARGDDGLRRQGATISESAGDLLDVSEKAIEIDRMFERPTATERVDLEACVDDVVSSLRDDHPAATVDTSVDVETVHTDPLILSNVLEQVIANGLEHAGEAPTLDVAVWRSDDTVEVAVSDDGPGIPQGELDPILNGDETDLNHASSFGLWFIYWGTHTLDGTVDVTTDDAGTDVTLRLPDRTPSGEDAVVQLPSDGIIA